MGSRGPRKRESAEQPYPRNDHCPRNGKPSQQSKRDDDGQRMLRGRGRAASALRTFHIPVAILMQEGEVDPPRLAGWRILTHVGFAGGYGCRGSIQFNPQKKTVFYYKKNLKPLKMPKNRPKAVQRLLKTKSHANLHKSA